MHLLSGPPWLQLSVTWSCCPAEALPREPGTWAGARALWARLQWGSCLYILQFGSHSTDVWGRPPLPLPLLLSAWPIPARVSAVPTGEGGGSSRAWAPPQLRTTWPSLVNGIPGRLQGPSLFPKSLADSEGPSGRARLLVCLGPCYCANWLSLRRAGHSSVSSVHPMAQTFRVTATRPGSFPPARGKPGPPHTEHSLPLPTVFHAKARLQPEQLPPGCSRPEPSWPSLMVLEACRAGQPVWPKPLFPPGPVHTLLLWPQAGVGVAEGSPLAGGVWLRGKALE